MASTPTVPEQRRAFVALAGGGAKGLIHVGALRALEDRSVAFHGLAGTSAGAIIAALKASGFSSREMLDPNGGSPLMNELAAIDPEITRVSDIFGKVGWGRILAFRWATTHVWLLWMTSGLIAATLPTSLIIAGATRSGSVIAGAVLVTAVIAGLTFWQARLLVGGLADVRRFRDAMAILLQRRLFPGQPNRSVVLGDFGKDGRPTLKIVSANLSKRRLQLFSPERTPDVAVADAVAASICLPIIFQPWRIAASSFVDGGIVSNLPAWPFDEERELDPEALTIAVEIADTSDAPLVSRFNWLPSAVRTALFGSGELNLRVSGGAEQLVLESRLNLLQFDLTREQARQEVRDAEAAARVRLDKRLFRRPELYRNACEVTRGLAEDVLESALGASAEQVRVAIAVPDKDYHHSLRLQFSAGYEAHADEGMLVPLVGSVLGEAWRSRESRFELAPIPHELDLPGQANRLRRKLRWPKLEWQLCIPILDENGSARVAVHIGGDAKLPRDERLAIAVTEIESAVSEFFNLILRELFELEDGDGLEEHHV